MNHDIKLSADKCLLLVVDIQEAFVPHIHEMPRVIERSRIMIEAAKLLGVPVITSEQYPKGLGRTVEPLQNALGDCRYYDKVTFSLCGDEALQQAIRDRRRKQCLLVGIETHVCISQTTLDLLAMDMEPYLLTDALSSRREGDHDVALRRLLHAGATLTTTEATIMEITRSSKHPQFKALSQLVK